MRRWFASALIVALSLFGAACDDLYEDEGAGEAEQQDDNGGY